MHKKSILLSLLSTMTIVAGIGYFASYSGTCERNDLLLQNVEALSNDESNNPRYPQSAGKAEFCKLYIYMKGGIIVSTTNYPNTAYELSGEYTKEIREGLKDRCPDKGGGCNPYSCQEIPY